MRSTTDGAVFSGATPAEVVAAMAAASFALDEQQDVRVFMARTAMRLRGLQGVSIRSTTPEDFLADLQIIGMIKQVPGR